MDNKSLTHTRRKCQYHIVFISKYKGIIWKGERRYKGNHRYIMQIRYKGVEIIAGGSMYKLCPFKYCNTTQN